MADAHIGRAEAPGVPRTARGKVRVRGSPGGADPGSVREYGLPSTPLKDTEKRAGSWQREMHVEQTEIDALASLRPDLLLESWWPSADQCQALIDSKASRGGP